MSSPDPRVTVGVLALQGAFAAHIAILRDLGVDAFEVKTTQQLASVDALVIPGGESTTMSMLLVKGGMLEPLRERAAAGMAIFGTCAGMILCSEKIEDGRADQHCLAAIPIVSRRNGYGRQIDSFEADLDVDGLDEPFHGVFIRAPIVESVADEVRVLATVDGQPVLCSHGPVTVASFHPELSGDPRLHQRWLIDAGLLGNALADASEESGGAA
ncbi:MAG: pyridoxal 5'-phosphate synthase glutaminase subunit PdxT [Actinomycetota bacterium]